MPAPAKAAPSRSVRAAGTAGSRAAAYVLGFFASIVVARALEPAGRGAYFTIITVATLALHLGHFSVQQANLSLWLTTHDRASLASSSLVLGVGAGIVAATATAIAVVWLFPDVVPITSTGLLLVALGAAPAAICTIYLRGLLVLDDRIGMVNWSALLSALAQTLLIVILGFAHLLTVAAVTGVWALATAAPLLVLVPAVRRWPGFGSPSGALIRRAVSLGSRYHPGTVATLLMLRIDVLMLSATVAPREVGIYSLAVTLAELTLLITDSTAQVAAPGQIAEDEKEAAAYTARVARANALVGLLVVTALVVGGPLLIPLVFGAGFAPATAPLAALAPGIFAMSGQWPLRFFATRLKRTGLVSSAALIALVVNVCLNLVLIPPWGIVGAGVASSVSYVGMTAFYAAWFLSATKQPASTLVARPADVAIPLAAALGDMRRRRGRGASFFTRLPTRAVAGAKKATDGRGPAETEPSAQR